MKGLESSGSSTNVHDFLQDAQGFLEQTLAVEKLSRTALEHRSRLMLKLSNLLKEYDHHQMEMYIDMSPTLKSFFHPSLDGSASSTSDSNSIRDIPLPNGEEFYDVPLEAGPTVSKNNKQNNEQSIKTATYSLSGAKRKGFMQRFLKSTNVQIIEESSNVKDDCIYDDASSNPTKITLSTIYDDAGSSQLKSTLSFIYDDAASSIPAEATPTKAITYDDVVVESGLLYDDAFSSLTVPPPPPEDEYDDVASLGDSDGVSLKSGASEYGAAGTSSSPSHRWYISTSEAVTQAVRHGVMKRRNGRKLLSAWRRCYSVLLPAHLLMYAGEGDSRPRIVIDLSEPNITVRRVLKQGTDTKRLKTHPFVLLHEDKPLYEMSTKSREETDGWITSLQSALSQTPEMVEQRDLLDDEEENVYDDPVEVQHQQRRPKARLELIQGRHLPSVPSEEVNKTAKPLTNSSSSKMLMATIFKFPRGHQKNSTADDPLIIVNNKRQSVDSSTDTDDLYQELPSPTRSATPYSSVESIHNGIQDEIYDDASSARKPIKETVVKKDSKLALLSVPDGEKVLPVYDIPSPGIRPLFQSTDETDKSNSFPVAAEVYDVPPPNPKRISPDPPVAEAPSYDRLPTPPRSVTATTKPQHKMARFWQEKLGESSPLFRKEPSPPKCLPSQQQVNGKETKSVGRSFSRVSVNRTPLTSLTELMASSSSSGGAQVNPGGSKTSVLKEKLAKDIKSSFNRGPISPAISVNNGKKEPPPRPPAPSARPITNLAAELSQQLAKRQQRQQQNNLEEAEVKQKEEDLKLVSPPSPTGEQFKARWAYVAENSSELSLNKGESVEVLSKNGPSWFVRVRNKKGLVPCDYLIPVQNPV